MKQIRKRSSVPIYITSAVWLLYCIFFPLYKPSHYMFLIIVGVASYVLFSKLFPGKIITVEIPEEPVTTGDAQIDALYKEGQLAICEMERLRSTISEPEVRIKIDTLINVTGRIFDDVLEDHSDYSKVERFSGYFLPATLKLLNAYDRMSGQGIEGENISGTLRRIEEILDTTIAAYEKQLDALFANQALDIETDIDVLEAMLKREGLSEKDF